MSREGPCTNPLSAAAPEAQPMLLLLAAKLVFYASLVLHLVNYRRYVAPLTSAIFNLPKRTHFGLHAFVVAGFMTCSASEETALHYVGGVVLVWAIWDGGAILQGDLSATFWIHLHHMGTIIAYIYQPSASAS